jgi:hypothetical protein
MNSPKVACYETLAANLLLALAFKVEMLWGTHKGANVLYPYIVGWCEVHYIPNQLNCLWVKKSWWQSFILPLCDIKNLATFFKNKTTCSIPGFLFYGTKLRCHWEHVGECIWECIAQATSFLHWWQMSGLVHSPAQMTHMDHHTLTAPSGLLYLRAQLIHFVANASLGCCTDSPELSSPSFSMLLVA